MLFNVFRYENRKNGLEQHIGTIEADNAEQAKRLAVDSFECDQLHHLTVSTACEPITLREFNNSVKPITYLWLRTPNHPGGVEYFHNTESDGEDYCDVYELIGDLNMWDLTGSISDAVNGRWEWDGEGKAVDERGNTIYSIKAL